MCVWVKGAVYTQPVGLGVLSSETEGIHAGLCFGWRAVHFAHLVFLDN